MARVSISTHADKITADFHTYQDQPSEGFIIVKLDDESTITLHSRSEKQAEMLRTVAKIISEMK